ncbi:hypothetical protein QT990_01400, partial [Microcoleus sp. T3_B1]|uniref:hypothetical protein n=1 Tax=Microcoleus sp. T3_B1 TaxID=3055425 RepID=UPI002FD1F9E1
PQENSLFVEQAEKPVHKKLIDNGATSEFKRTIGFNQKIPIPGRLTPADATKILHHPRAKF